MTPQALLKQRDDLPPLEEGESRYIVADNGVFLERRDSMFTTCSRVNQRDLRLEWHQPSCELHCGKIPRLLHRAMLGFFKHAHELHDGEVALVLLYHPQRRRFRWHCPHQIVERYPIGDRWVTADYIHFDNPLELPEGYIHFGDAHLHPGPPNPSAMDMADDQDGLHLIVGNILTRISYSVTFVMDGTRFRIPPEDVFEDLSCEPLARPPKVWMQQIEIKNVKPSWQSKPVQYVSYTPSSSYTRPSNGGYYDRRPDRD